MNLMVRLSSLIVHFKRFFKRVLNKYCGSIGEEDELNDKIMQKINALKAMKSSDPDYKEDEDSIEFEYGDIELNTSMKSDEIDEIIRNTNKEIDDGKGVAQIHNFTETNKINIDQNRNASISKLSLNNCFSESNENKPNGEANEGETTENSNLDNSSPEALRKLLNNIPDGILLEPIEDTEFIADEDDKIKELLEGNKITLKEYNKLMKHKYKSQLNITGLSNISDFNMSNTNLFADEKRDQTVLFGKNFVDNSRLTSEVSMLKARKDTSDEFAQNSPDQSEPPKVELEAQFSMSKQIEEFKRQFEQDLKREESDEEDAKVEVDNLKTPLKQVTRMSDLSNFDDAPVKFTESFTDDIPDRDVDCQSEIHLEWENIVREATGKKVNKKATEDIAERESQFFEFLNSKRSHLRDNTSKKYKRSKQGEVGFASYDYDPYHFQSSSNIFNQSILQQDQSAAEEQAEARKILKVELIIAMLKRKNIHKNMISDFEQSRCKKYLKNFLEKNPDCEEAHLGLSQLYYSLGIHDKALQHLANAITKNPKEPYYLALKALYLYTVKQWNKNVSCLQN